MKKLTLLLCLFLVTGLAVVRAQAPYGVGDNIDVPYVAPGTLTLDGNGNESAWNSAVEVNMIGFWDGAWGGVPFPDIEAKAKLLWSEDWLYIYAKVEDYEFFFGPDTANWIGEQIMVGVDRILAGDPPGGNYADDWSGAPWNAPDKGPTVYKINDKGITLNWGGWWDDPNQTWWELAPIDSGWVAGQVFVNNDDLTWGVEMGIWLPQIRTNSMVGFNIGGAAATPDTTAVPWEWGEGTYAYYAWHPQPADTAVGYPSDYIAGDIQRRAQSFGTLTFVGGPEPYGIADNIDVPWVAPDAIVFDGVGDEAAWTNAAAVNMIGFWDGAWGGVPFPDVEANAKLLWSNDWLYVYAKVEDYEFFFGPDTANWIGEQIMVGIDGPMYGDPAGGNYADDWSGAPWNAPDKGPTVYKINDKGITSNWGGWWDDPNQTWWEVLPVDTGWVVGQVFVNNEDLTWGVEMKIYVPQIALGTRIGFNIGGAAATPDTTAVPWEWGEGTYAYYAWHPQPGDTAVGYPSDYIAGDIQRRAKCFGMLTFKQSITGVNDYELERGSLPEMFTLTQNYPNPFNPSTTLTYRLQKDARVCIDVYNVLGKKVGNLVERRQAAGTYSVKWDAGDLASGIYFFQLRVNDQLISSRKAMLLK
ncbi:MAG TPA: sugar-binding protein [bacterium]|nr:sugar-binding protein [bacterium]